MPSSDPTTRAQQYVDSETSCVRSRLASERPQTSAIRFRATMSEMIAAALKATTSACLRWVRHCHPRWEGPFGPRTVMATMMEAEPSRIADRRKPSPDQGGRTIRSPDRPTGPQQYSPSRRRGLTVPCWDQRVLRRSGVARRFGATAVLHGVDLTIESGETIGLIGESGSEESTLAGIVTDVPRPSAGTGDLFRATTRSRSGRTQSKLTTFRSDDVPVARRVPEPLHRPMSHPWAACSTSRRIAGRGSDPAPPAL